MVRNDAPSVQHVRAVMLARVACDSSRCPPSPRGRRAPCSRQSPNPRRSGIDDETGIGFAGCDCPGDARPRYRRILRRISDCPLPPPRIRRRPARGLGGTRRVPGAVFSWPSPSLPITTERMSARRGKCRHRPTQHVRLAGHDGNPTLPERILRQRRDVPAASEFPRPSRARDPGRQLR